MLGAQSWIYKKKNTLNLKHHLGAQVSVFGFQFFSFPLLTPDVLNQNDRFHVT
jgi:hypothetical protein